MSEDRELNEAMAKAIASANIVMRDPKVAGTNFEGEAGAIAALIWLKNAGFAVVRVEREKVRGKR